MMKFDLWFFFPKGLSRVLERGILLFSILWFAGCVANPVTHQQQFILMGESQEVQIGNEAYPVYTQMSSGLFKDDALQAYVQNVGLRLARVSHRPQLPYAFNLVNASELNAYALPGGKISITRGLLSRMNNEAELASVLGHEIGHVAARHAASAYTRQVFASVINVAGTMAIEASGVQGGNLLREAGMIATNLSLMRYSRDQERQSDELGLEYLVRAGYNPEGFVQTMEILMQDHNREPSKLESYFSSHPLTTERINTARQRVASYDAGLKTESRLQTEPFMNATKHLRSLLPAYGKMDEGMKLLTANNPNAAITPLEEATRLAPDQALIWVNLAVAEASLEHYDQAMTTSEKAVALYPDLYQARYISGVLSFHGGRYEQSLNHLNIAGRLVPDQPQVFFWQGRDHEALGRRDQAARQYSAVLKQVQKGPMAEYCYKKLVAWGYLRPVPRQKR